MLRGADPDDELNEKLLQAAVNPVKARDFQVQAPGFVEPVNEITSNVRALAPHLEVGGGGLAGLGVNGSIGGVSMSAQSSAAGWSDKGEFNGTPLGRFGESGGGGGGIPMARSGSGRGRGRGRAV